MSSQPRRKYVFSMSTKEKKSRLIIGLVAFMLPTGVFDSGVDQRVSILCSMINVPQITDRKPEDKTKIYKILLKLK